MLRVLGRRLLAASTLTPTIASRPVHSRPVRTPFLTAVVGGAKRSIQQANGPTTVWNLARGFAGAARNKRGRGGVKGKGKVKGRRRKSRGGAVDIKPPPPLSRVMRMFVARVHPDKFVHYPEERQVNEESLSQLTGFLSNVSNPDEEFMPAQKIAMHFWIMETVDDGSDNLRKVEFSLRTTGGDCKNLVRRQLEDLFTTAGITDPSFEWDDKFWQSATTLKPQEFDEDDDDESGTDTPKAQPMSMDEILQNMDPILQAIAAVPWLQPKDRISVFVKEKAFADLEAQGWRNLKPAAEAIWAGERELDAVANNMDMEHRSIIASILRHTHLIESGSA